MGALYQGKVSLGSTHENSDSIKLGGAVPLKPLEMNHHR